MPELAESSGSEEDSPERAPAKAPPKAKLYRRVPQRCLHMFAGRQRAGDVAEELRRLGWKCVDIDTVRDGAHMDILDDAVWRRLEEELEEGLFGFVLAGTPCSTFSESREHPGGPPVVRSTAHIEGLPNLRGGHREEVRKANVLVDRTARACDLVAAKGGGFAIENPHPREGKPALFDMPCLRRLREKYGGRYAEFDQCVFGAASTKPTRVMYHRGGFITLRGRCSHPPQWQTRADGTRVWAAHPPLWGDKKDGVWRTKNAAEYPPALCRELAKCIAVTQPLVAADALAAKSAKDQGKAAR